MTEQSAAAPEERVRRRHKPREPVKVVPADLNARLENWGRWARTTFRKQHCASIEWKFSIPKFRAMDAQLNGLRNAELEAILRKPETEPVDEPDAWVIEQAVTSARIGYKDMGVLKARYVLLSFPRDTCHALSIRLGQYDRKLYEAALRVEEVAKIIARMGESPFAKAMRHLNGKEA